MNRTLIAVMGGAFGFALAEIGCWYFSVRDEPVILLLIHLPMVLGFSSISYGVFARSKEQDKESSLEAISLLINDLREIENEDANPTLPFDLIVRGSTAPYQ
jgi:hypothetical protein